MRFFKFNGNILQLTPGFPKSSLQGSFELSQTLRK